MKATIEIFPLPYDVEYEIRVNGQLVFSCRTITVARSYAMAIKKALSACGVESETKGE